MSNVNQNFLGKTKGLTFRQDSNGRSNIGSPVLVTEVYSLDKENGSADHFTALMSFDDPHPVYNRRKGLMNTVRLQRPDEYVVKKVDEYGNETQLDDSVFDVTVNDLLNEQNKAIFESLTPEQQTYIAKELDNVDSVMETAGLSEEEWVARSSNFDESNVARNLLESLKRAKGSMFSKDYVQMYHARHAIVENYLKWTSEVIKGCDKLLSTQIDGVDLWTKISQSEDVRLKNFVTNYSKVLADVYPASIKEVKDKDDKLTTVHKDMLGMVSQPNQWLHGFNVFRVARAVVPHVLAGRNISQEDQAYIQDFYKDIDDPTKINMDLSKINPKTISEFVNSKDFEAGLDWNEAYFTDGVSIEVARLHDMILQFEKTAQQEMNGEEVTPLGIDVSVFSDIAYNLKTHYPFEKTIVFSGEPKKLEQGDEEVKIVSIGDNNKERIATEYGYIKGTKEYDEFLEKFQSTQKVVFMDTAFIQNIEGNQKDSETKMGVVSHFARHHADDLDNTKEGVYLSATSVKIDDVQEIQRQKQTNGGEFGEFLQDKLATALKDNKTAIIASMVYGDKGSKQGEAVIFNGLPTFDNGLQGKELRQQELHKQSVFGALSQNDIGGFAERVAIAKAQVEYENEISLSNDPANPKNPTEQPAFKKIREVHNRMRENASKKGEKVIFSSNVNIQDYNKIQKDLNGLGFSGNEANTIVSALYEMTTNSENNPTKFQEDYLSAITTAQSKAYVQDMREVALLVAGGLFDGDNSNNQEVSQVFEKLGGRLSETQFVERFGMGKEAFCNTFLGSLSPYHSLENDLSATVSIGEPLKLIRYDNESAYNRFETQSTLVSQVILNRLGIGDDVVERMKANSENTGVINAKRFNVAGMVKAYLGDTTLHNIYDEENNYDREMMGPIGARSFNQDNINSAVTGVTFHANPTAQVELSVINERATGGMVYTPVGDLSISNGRGGVAGQTARVPASRELQVKRLQETSDKLNPFLQTNDINSTKIVVPFSANNLFSKAQHNNQKREAFVGLERAGSLESFAIGGRNGVLKALSDNDNRKVIEGMVAGYGVQQTSPNGQNMAKLINEKKGTTGKIPPAEFYKLSAELNLAVWYANILTQQSYYSPKVDVDMETLIELSHRVPEASSMSDNVNNNAVFGSKPYGNNKGGGAYGQWQEDGRVRTGVIFNHKGLGKEAVETLAKLSQAQGEQHQKYFELMKTGGSEQEKAQIKQTIQVIEDIKFATVAPIASVMATSFINSVENSLKDKDGNPRPIADLVSEGVVIANTKGGKTYYSAQMNLDDFGLIHRGDSRKIALNGRPNSLALVVGVMADNQGMAMLNGTKLEVQSKSLRGRNGSSVVNMGLLTGKYPSFMTENLSKGKYDDIFSKVYQCEKIIEQHKALPVYQAERSNVVGKEKATPVSGANYDFKAFAWETSKEISRLDRNVDFVNYVYVNFGSTKGSKENREKVYESYKAVAQQALSSISVKNEGIKTPFDIAWKTLSDMQLKNTSNSEAFQASEYRFNKLAGFDEPNLTKGKDTAYKEFLNRAIDFSKLNSVSATIGAGAIHEVFDKWGKDKDGNPTYIQKLGSRQIHYSMNGNEIKQELVEKNQKPQPLESAKSDKLGAGKRINLQDSLKEGVLPADFIKMSEKLDRGASFVPVCQFEGRNGKGRISGFQELSHVFAPNAEGKSVAELKEDSVAVIKGKPVHFSKVNKKFFGSGDGFIPINNTPDTSLMQALDLTVFEGYQTGVVGGALYGSLESRNNNVKHPIIATNDPVSQITNAFDMGFVNFNKYFDEKREKETGFFVNIVAEPQKDLSLGEKADKIKHDLLVNLAVKAYLDPELAKNLVKYKPLPSNLPLQEKQDIKNQVMEWKEYESIAKAIDSKSNNPISMADDYVKLLPILESAKASVDRSIVVSYPSFEIHKVIKDNDGNSKYLDKNDKEVVLDDNFDILDTLYKGMDDSNFKNISQIGNEKTVEWQKGSFSGLQFEDKIDNRFAISAYAIMNGLEKQIKQQVGFDYEYRNPHPSYDKIFENIYDQNIERNQSADYDLDDLDEDYGYDLDYDYGMVYDSSYRPTQRITQPVAPDEPQQDSNRRHMIRETPLELNAPDVTSDDYSEEDYWGVHEEDDDYENVAKFEYDPSDNRFAELAKLDLSKLFNDDEIVVLKAEDLAKNAESVPPANENANERTQEQEVGQTLSNVASNSKSLMTEPASNSKASKVIFEYAEHGEHPPTLAEYQKLKQAGESVIDNPVYDSVGNAIDYIKGSAKKIDDYDETSILKSCVRVMTGEKFANKELLNRNGQDCRGVVLENFANAIMSGTENLATYDTPFSRVAHALAKETFKNMDNEERERSPLVALMAQVGEEKVSEMQPMPDEKATAIKADEKATAIKVSSVTGLAVTMATLAETTKGQMVLADFCVKNAEKRMINDKKADNGLSADDILMDDIVATLAVTTLEQANKNPNTTLTERMEENMKEVRVRLSKHAKEYKSDYTKKLVEGMSNANSLVELSADTLIGRRSSSNGDYNNGRELTERIKTDEKHGNPTPPIYLLAKGLEMGNDWAYLRKDYTDTMPSLETTYSRTKHGYLNSEELEKTNEKENNYGPNGL